jgi:hypothetical protein
MGFNELLFDDLNQFASLLSLLVSNAFTYVALATFTANFVACYANSPNGTITQADIWKRGALQLFGNVLVVGFFWAFASLGVVVLAVGAPFMAAMVAFSHIAYAQERGLASKGVGRSFGLMAGGYWINFGVLLFAAVIVCLWSLMLTYALETVLGVVLGFLSDSYSFETLRLLNVGLLMLTSLLWNLSHAIAMTVIAVNYYNAVERQEFVQLKQKIDTIGAHLQKPTPEATQARKIVL